MNSNQAPRSLPSEPFVKREYVSSHPSYDVEPMSPSRYDAATHHNTFQQVQSVPPYVTSHPSWG